MITLVGIDKKISRANAAFGQPTYYAAGSSSAGKAQGGLFSVTANAWLTAKAGFSTFAGITDGAATFSTFVHAGNTAPTVIDFEAAFYCRNADYIFLVSAPYEDVDHAYKVAICKYSYTGADITEDDYVDGGVTQIDGDTVTDIFADESDNLHLLIPTVSELWTNEDGWSGKEELREVTIETSGYTGSSAWRLFMHWDPIKPPEYPGISAPSGTLAVSSSIRTKFPDETSAFIVEVSANADMSSPFVPLSTTLQFNGRYARCEYTMPGAGTYYARASVTVDGDTLYSDTEQFKVNYLGFISNKTNMGGGTSYPDGTLIWPIGEFGAQRPMYDTAGNIIVVAETTLLDTSYGNNQLCRVETGVFTHFDMGADYGNSSLNCLLSTGKDYCSNVDNPANLYVLDDGGYVLVTFDYAAAGIDSLIAFPTLYLEGETTYLLGAADFTDGKHGFYKVSVSASGFGTPTSIKFSTEHPSSPQVSHDGNSIYYCATGGDGYTYFFRLGTAQSNAIWYMGI